MSIILYSTGCPKCRQLKMLLDGCKVQYIENNSVDEMLELGLSVVPVLSVGGVLMNYSEAQNWIINTYKE